MRRAWDGESCLRDEVASVTIKRASPRSRADLLLPTETMASPLIALLSLPQPLSLSPPNLDLLLEPFLPSDVVSSDQEKERTLALAVLSRKLDAPTSSLLRTKLATLLSPSSGSAGRVQGLATLTALLQVTPQTAIKFLQDPSFQKAFSQAVEIISTPSQPKDRGERPALVQLLVEAAGVQSLRAQVRTQAGEWLESVIDEDEETAGDDGKPTRAMAAVAVIKLRLGREEGMPAPVPKANEVSLESIATLLSSVYISATSLPSPSSSKTTLVALEGISYLTLASTPGSTSYKSTLITPTSSFLHALLPTTPRPLNPASAYTLATLLHHLTAYPPHAPPPQVPAALGAQSAPPEPRDLVQSRNTLLLTFPLLPTLQLLSTSSASSSQTRGLVAHVHASLIDDRAHRASLIQSGVAKDLRTLATTIDPTKRLAGPAQRTAVQALAKLLITAKPDLVFDHSGLLDVSFLFAVEVYQIEDTSASDEDPERLLRIFECLMALTNIASLGGEGAEKLAAVLVGREKGKEGGRSMMRIVEGAMLSSHPMVQRAATQLACNLVCTDAGTYFYEQSLSPPPPLPTADSSTPSPAPPTPTSPTGLSPSLHLLLALCASPDLQTQLAASGAMASLLSATPIITLALFSDPKRMAWGTVLDLIRDGSDEGLQLRGWDWLESLGRWLGEKEVEEEAKKGVREGMDEETRGLVERAKEGMKGEGRQAVDELVGTLFASLSL